MTRLEIGEFRRTIKMERASERPRRTHGDIPASADWVADRPSEDAALRVAAVRCVRFDDGSIVKFYKMNVRPAVVAAKRELTKRKIKELKHAMERLEKREAARRKRVVRLMLATLGR